MAPIRLGYWDIRGLAQPIRFLLEHSGLEWEDKIYVTGPLPDCDKSCWRNEKENYGFDFPNLPWLIDGDVKLTQTLAIMRYLGRKTGMVGESEGEKQRVDLIEEEWVDFKAPFFSMCYDKNFNNMKDPYLQAVQEKLARFSKFLGNKPYFAGDKITYVDFLMYELFWDHVLLSPTILSGYPNLTTFLTRVESLPRIKAFMTSSPKYIKGPINNRQGAWST